MANPIAYNGIAITPFYGSENIISIRLIIYRLIYIQRVQLGGEHIDRRYEDGGGDGEKQRGNP